MNDNLFFFRKICYQNYDNVKTELVLNNKIKSPFVSIIIPTYRRIKTFEESLCSALNQNNFDNYEVIVIDNDYVDLDCSETFRIIQNYKKDRLAYYRNQQNLGMTGNWNRGICLAKGEWVTMLHDDDWLSPNFLEKVFFQKPCDAGLLAVEVEIGAHGYNYHNNIGAQSWYRRYSHIFYKIDIPRLIYEGVSPAPGILIKKEILLQSGGFNDSYYPIMDYELYCYCSINNPAYILDSCLAYYRITDNEAFKGNVLFDMTKKSLSFKKYLLDLRPSKVAALFYFQQMSAWLYKLKKHKNLHTSPVTGKGKFYLIFMSNFIVNSVLRIIARGIAVYRKKSRQVINKEC